MCTVTLVPHSKGLRIVCNRDERRDRPLADPPQVHTDDGVRSVWPIDPFSGGTWIGANEAGLVLVLLNRNPRARGRARTAPRSRGTIIPALMHCDNLGDVTRAARTLPAGEFASFILLAIHKRAAAEFRNIGSRITTRRFQIAAPTVFTSSSLGDRLVTGPRRALFRAMVENSETPLRAQTAFHRHAWKTRPEVSVQMTRADASTVSRTVIDVTRALVRMTYAPLTAPRISEPRTSVSLRLTSSPAPQLTGSPAEKTPRL